MVEPYQAGIVKGRSPSIKTVVEGHLVTVLDTCRENRQLQLIHPFSRCVRKDDIHELVLTDDIAANPGASVNRVAGLGFMVFHESGVLMVGDHVTSPDRGEIGIVAGFDESHAPNHFNVLLYSPDWHSGRALELLLQSIIHFEGQLQWPVDLSDG